MKLNIDGIQLAGIFLGIPVIPKEATDVIADVEGESTVKVETCLTNLGSGDAYAGARLFTEEGPENQSTAWDMLIRTEIADVTLEEGFASQSLVLYMNYNSAEALQRKLHAALEIYRRKEETLERVHDALCVLNRKEQE